MVFWQGWCVKVNDESSDKEIGEDIGEVFKMFEVFSKVCDVFCWLCEFGGVVLFIGVNDGQWVDMLVNEDWIKGIDFIMVFDVFECVFIVWYLNFGYLCYGYLCIYQICLCMFISGFVFDEFGKLNVEVGIIGFIDVYELWIVFLFGLCVECN